MSKKKVTTVESVPAPTAEAPKKELTAKEKKRIRDAKYRAAKRAKAKKEAAKKPTTVAVNKPCTCEIPKKVIAEYKAIIKGMSTVLKTIGSVADNEYIRRAAITGINLGNIGLDYTDSLVLK